MAAAVNPRERATSDIVVSAPPALPSDAPASDALIRAANAELTRRTGTGLDIAVSVLLEQRNQALRNLQAASEQAQREHAQHVIDQDAFIAFLMADYEKQLLAVQEELVSVRQQLARERTLARTTGDDEIVDSAVATPRNHAATDISALSQQLFAVQEALQAAYAEVDETRADAARLQDERDTAIRETNDLKFDFEQRLEAARDEAASLQWQLDESQRKIADLSDAARDEAYRASEQLDEARRKLDERNEETRSLRARLALLDEEMQTRPPPAAAIELENARKEAQLLRKALIEAKRELSRLKNEGDAARLRTRPIIPVENRPATAEQRPASAANNPPARATERRPAGAADNRPAPPATEQRPASAANDRPAATDHRPIPAAEIRTIGAPVRQR
ncbi:MAG: hypothetical protein ACOY0T_13655 [Myxococcota bacterium]